METRTKAPCVIEKLLFCFSVALGQKPVVLNPKTRMMRSADKGVGEATALELWTLCEVVGVALKPRTQHLGSPFLVVVVQGPACGLSL